MILETVRMITDSLASGSAPSYSGSVNALLPGITRDGGDASPPSIMTYADETRNAIVASGRYPTSLPSLVVTVDGNTKLNSETHSDVRDADVGLIIRYIQSNVNAATGNRDAHYTIRAVIQSVANYMKSSNVSSRVRNGIQVIECISMELVPLYEPIEDAVCTGALKLVFRVRDTVPTTLVG
jgi:hypothetical protein